MIFEWCVLKFDGEDSKKFWVIVVVQEVFSFIEKYFKFYLIGVCFRRQFRMEFYVWNIISNNCSFFVQGVVLGVKIVIFLVDVIKKCWFFNIGVFIYGVNYLFDVM